MTEGGGKGEGVELQGGGGLWRGVMVRPWGKLTGHVSLGGSHRRPSFPNTHSLETRALSYSCFPVQMILPA